MVVAHLANEQTRREAFQILGKSAVRRREIFQGIGFKSAVVEGAVQFGLLNVCKVDRLHPVDVLIDLPQIRINQTGKGDGLGGLLSGGVALYNFPETLGSVFKGARVPKGQAFIQQGHAYQWMLGVCLSELAEVQQGFFTSVQF